MNKTEGSFYLSNYDCAPSPNHSVLLRKTLAVRGWKIYTSFGVYICATAPNQQHMIPAPEFHQKAINILSHINCQPAGDRVGAGVYIPIDGESV